MYIYCKLVDTERILTFTVKMRAFKSIFRVPMSYNLKERVVEY